MTGAADGRKERPRKNISHHNRVAAPNNASRACLAFLLGCFETVRSQETAIRCGMFPSSAVVARNAVTPNAAGRVRHTSSARTGFSTKSLFRGHLVHIGAGPERVKRSGRSNTTPAIRTPTSVVRACLDDTPSERTSARTSRRPKVSPEFVCPRLTDAAKKLPKHNSPFAPGGEKHGYGLGQKFVEDDDCVLLNALRYEPLECELNPNSEGCDFFAEDGADEDGDEWRGQWVRVPYFTKSDTLFYL